MIANIVKPGHKTRGVLNYLYGPGRANEHTDPHLVASWDGFAAEPLTALHHRGRHLAPWLLKQQAATVRQALPDLAEQILAEPDWPALAATLNDATAAGRAPSALLTQAARHQELDTATSLSEVLAWRLNRLREPVVRKPPRNKAEGRVRPSSTTTPRAAPPARPRTR
ncbi:hypothetical protein [Streptomyces sp. NPDC006971]|uniref:hypothetical protein n=1 Tax=Streptomyces sp. NPDC006971 TaxID=3154784 RepID=UPI0033E45867